MKGKKISLFLAIILLLSCLGGCVPQKAAVTGALSNSISAFSRAAEAVFPEKSFSPENGYSQETTVVFSSLPSELGLPVKPSVCISGASADGECRESRLELKLGSLSLFNIAARVEGNLCALSCPVLSRNTILINLDTLPEDLNSMGLGSLVSEEDAGLSVISAAAPSPDFVMTDKEETELLGALKEVIKDIGVKSSGTEKRDINGFQKSCHLYTVTVPSSDLCRVWDALEPAVLRTLKEAPVMLAEAEEPVSAEELLSDLRAALVSTGDWTLELGVCDKLVMSAAAEFSGTFRDTGFSLRPLLTVGGGREYVDDLRMSVAWDEEEAPRLVWTSHGDHSARGGAYTDESHLTLGSEGELVTTMRYAAAEKKDNLSLSVQAEDISLRCAGTFCCTEEELSFTDGIITLDGEKTAELTVDSRMSAYTELVPHDESAVPLTETDWSELYDFLSGILSRIDGISKFFAAA